MASRILPEYPVPIPAGRQIVSPANVLGVGPRRASVGAGLEPCNGNDRRQRRKQGVAVGTAASRMQGSLKGRRMRWEPQPVFVSEEEAPR